MASVPGKSTRNELLLLLRQRGPLTAEAIGTELGITPNAVRQHLVNLEREGMVTSQSTPTRRGRPQLRFTLTDNADAAFPKRYGQLASMVLAEVQDMGGAEMLDDIFRRMATRRAAGLAKDLEGLPHEERLERVIAWIQRANTLTECEEAPGGGVRLKIHNCPFRATALRFPQVCSLTPHLLGSLLDTAISQDGSIHRRDPFCSFIIHPPAAE